MKGLILAYLLLMFAGRAWGKVICEQFATYYTYCYDSEVCCRDNKYCCIRDEVTIIREQTSYSAGVIAAIVIGSLALLVALVYIAWKVYKHCTRGHRAVDSPRMVNVAAAGNHYPTLYHGAQGYPQGAGVTSGMPRQNTPKGGRVTSSIGMPPKYTPTGGRVTRSIGMPPQYTPKGMPPQYTP